MKAACNKVIKDVFGTLWLIGRAGAATADVSFAEEMKRSVDGSVEDSLEQWTLKYHPSQQEMGGTFETLYGVADLASGVVSAGKLGLSIARKAALKRAAAKASKQGLPGSPSEIASAGASRQMSNGPAAEAIGEAFIKDPANVNVDLAVQQHRHASKLKGIASDVPLESAHLAPTSAVRNVPGYSRGAAETVLLPREHHRAFDRYWMKWARKRVKDGCKTTTVSDFLKIQEEALDSIPALRGRTADTMKRKLFDEYFRQLGLKPDTMLRLPFSK